MLYLLASRQATTRVTVAALLGLSRNTIGRWLTLYMAGGLDGLLQVYRPVGKAPALTADQLIQLQDKLGDPTGFATYHDIRTWIALPFTNGSSATYSYGRTDATIAHTNKAPGYLQPGAFVLAQIATLSDSHVPKSRDFGKSGHKKITFLQAPQHTLSREQRHRQQLDHCF